MEQSELNKKLVSVFGELWDGLERPTCIRIGVAAMREVASDNTLELAARTMRFNGAEIVPDGAMNPRAVHFVNTKHPDDPRYSRLVVI